MDEQVDAALASYFERLDRGEAVDLESWLKQHGELAAALREVLVVEQRVLQMAGPSVAEASRSRRSAGDSPRDTDRGGTDVRAADQIAAQDSQAIAGSTWRSRVRTEGHGDRLENRRDGFASEASFELDPTADWQPDDRPAADGEKFVDLDRTVGESEVGDSFGRYRLMDEIGSGAMGTVRLAMDLELQRVVALKFPRFDTSEDSGTGRETLDRFTREARVLAQIQHPCICPVYDVGELHGQRYIAMPFIEGRTLADILKTSGRPAIRRAVLLVRKLALALHEAHAAGIVHRDLKPANIIVNKRGEPVIMDFGLARRTSGVHGDAVQTSQGLIVGTPAYMSPEQVSGKPELVGPHSDQYALGIMLYELLTGQRPYQGAITEILSQISDSRPAEPATLRPDIDPDLQVICLKMLARDPAARFESLAEAARTLTDWVRRASRSGTAANSRPASAAESDRPDGTPALSAGPATAQPTAATGACNEDELSEDDGWQFLQVEDSTPILERVRGSSRRRRRRRLSSDTFAALAADGEAGAGSRAAAGGRGLGGRVKGVWNRPLARGVLVAAASFLLTLAALVFVLRDGDVAVQVTVDESLKDDGFTLSVDGDSWRIDALGETLKLKPGRHLVTISRGDAVFRTDWFTVQRDGRNVLEVKLLDETPQTGEPSGVAAGSLGAVVEPSEAGGRNPARVPLRPAAEAAQPAAEAAQPAAEAAQPAAEAATAVAEAAPVAEAATAFGPGATKSPGPTDITGTPESHPPTNPPTPVAAADAGETRKPAGSRDMPPVQPQPTSTRPTSTQPTTTQPTSTQPTTTQPTTTQPATTQPASTQPATTRPATTRPAGTQPTRTPSPTATAGSTAGNPGRNTGDTPDKKAPADPDDDAGWVELFNGRTLQGWQSTDTNRRAWRVEDGAIVVSGPGRGYLHRDFRTKHFEVSLEYRTPEPLDYGPFTRAPDIQLGKTKAVEFTLINFASLAETRLGQDGGIGLPAEGKTEATRLRFPAGQWNQVRLKSAGYAFELWVNGQLAARKDDTEWLARFVPRHTAYTREAIRVVLQHWGPERVEFRNIRVRPLPPPDPSATPASPRVPSRVNRGGGFGGGKGFGGGGKGFGGGGGKGFGGGGGR